MALYYPPTVNGLQKTLAAQLDEGVTAGATLSNTTNIQNLKGLMVIDRIDTSGKELDEAKREYISFAGTSGSTVITLVRGLGGTTDQDHAVGAVVEFISDVVQQQAILDELALKASLTGTETLVNKTLTSPVINTPTGDVATKTGTETLTNKRITKRITTITSAAAPTINTNNCDVVDITAQAEAITSMTTNLSGTPTNFQTLIIRIKDNGTARAITWGASFEARGTDLPTTTVISKVLTVGLIYDTTTSKWGAVAVQQEE